MKKFLVLGIVLALLLALMGGPVFAAKSTVVHVNPGDSIQAAVDTPGVTKVIVYAGEYHQSVVINTNDITLIGEGDVILDGDIPADVGTTLGVDGIKLEEGVSGVTIEGFEIRDYSGTGNGQGNAIQAWNSGTSHITIENNVMHGNSWNAILVGNEGEGLHTNWVVRNNDIYDNGAYSLELTNAQHSEIRGNTVADGYIGILVQARNTRPNSGMVTVSNVRVMGNTISGFTYPVYILAQVSEPSDPFGPIDGAQATLEGVMFTGNDVTGGYYGVFAYGYLDGQVNNARIVNNTFSDLSYGVRIYGNAINNKVVNNTFTNVGTDVIDGGEDTKIPPVGKP